MKSQKVRKFDPVIAVCSVCELPMRVSVGKDKYPTCVHERFKGKAVNLVNGDIGLKNIPLSRFLRERFEVSKKHDDKREQRGGGLYRFQREGEMVVVYCSSHAEAEQREKRGWRVERDERGRPAATQSVETTIRRIRAA